MTFQSEYSDGFATFNVGSERRRLKIGMIEYYAISVLLNEAYKVGAQESVRSMASRFAEWARDEEMK